MAKILVVDDSQLIRQALVDILKEGGFDKVFEAEDGEKAVEIFNAEKPDLVFLDVIMPSMDGIEVLKEIVPKGAKVVMVSAVEQESVIAEAKELALGYIVKPFTATQIIDEVQKILG